MPPQNERETPFYVRTREGATCFLDTLEEAMECFASDEGYRLTFITGDLSVTIRRDESNEKGVSNATVSIFRTAPVEPPTLSLVK